jgi:hypothetical protein
MKNTFLWDVTPYCSCKNVSEESISSIIMPDRISMLDTINVSSAQIFNSDDVGDTFFQNVGSYKSHRA